MLYSSFVKLIGQRFGVAGSKHGPWQVCNSEVLKTFWLSRCGIHVIAFAFKCVLKSSVGHWIKVIERG